MSIQVRSRLIPAAGLLLIALLMYGGGCATIMHGTSQEVGIQSQPTDADVIIDNEDFGNTPVVAKLSRKDNHIIRVSMPGYRPFEATVTRSTSGWVWGNLVFGGLIGLAVDAISGSIYKLTPDQVYAELDAQAQGGLGDTDILITVVLEPDPAWEQIGCLVSSGQ